MVTAPLLFLLVGNAMSKSGYTECACRDCFEIVVSNDMSSPDYCEDCVKAGCPGYQGVEGMSQECQRPDAYGATDDETPEEAAQNKPKDLPPLFCDICNKSAIGVCSSPLGPVSHAYCKECYEANREVWSTLVGGLMCIEQGGEAEWVKPRIKATCEFYKRTEQELWDEVKEITLEYLNIIGAEQKENTT